MNKKLLTTLAILTLISPTVVSGAITLSVKTQDGRTVVNGGKYGVELRSSYYLDINGTTQAVQYYVTRDDKQIQVKQSDGHLVFQAAENGGNSEIKVWAQESQAIGAEQKTLTFTEVTMDDIKLSKVNEYGVLSPDEVIYTHPYEQFEACARNATEFSVYLTKDGSNGSKYILPLTTRNESTGFSGWWYMPESTSYNQLTIEASNQYLKKSQTFTINSSVQENNKVNGLLTYEDGRLIPVNSYAISLLPKTVLTFRADDADRVEVKRRFNNAIVEIPEKIADGIWQYTLPDDISAIENEDLKFYAYPKYALYEDDAKKYEYGVTLFDDVYVGYSYNSLNLKDGEICNVDPNTQFTTYGDYVNVTRDGEIILDNEDRKWNATTTEGRSNVVVTCVNNGYRKQKTIIENVEHGKQLGEIIPQFSNITPDAVARGNIVVQYPTELKFSCENAQYLELRVSGSYVDDYITHNATLYPDEEGNFCWTTTESLIDTGDLRVTAIRGNQSKSADYSYICVLPIPSISVRNMRNNETLVDGGTYDLAANDNLEITALNASNIIINSKEIKAEASWKAEGKAIYQISANDMDCDHFDIRASNALGSTNTVSFNATMHIPAFVGRIEASYVDNDGKVVESDTSGSGSSLTINNAKPGTLLKLKAASASRLYIYQRYTEGPEYTNSNGTIKYTSYIKGEEGSFILPASNNLDLTVTAADEFDGCSKYIEDYGDDSYEYNYFEDGHDNTLYAYGKTIETIQNYDGFRHYSVDGRLNGTVASQMFMNITGKNVTYRSTDPDVAEVDPNTGMITMKKVGTTRIVVAVDGEESTDNYGHSYLLYVTEPEDGAPDVTFPTKTYYAYTGTPLSFIAAQTTDGGTITYSVDDVYGNNSPVIDENAHTVTFPNPGSYTLRAKNGTGFDLAAIYVFPSTTDMVSAPSCHVADEPSKTIETGTDGISCISVGNSGGYFSFYDPTEQSYLAEFKIYDSSDKEIKFNDNIEITEDGMIEYYLVYGDIKETVIENSLTHKVHTYLAPKDPVADWSNKSVSLAEESDAKLEYAKYIVTTQSESEAESQSNAPARVADTTMPSDLIWNEVESPFTATPQQSEIDALAANQTLIYTVRAFRTVPAVENAHIESNPVNLSFINEGQHTGINNIGTDNSVDAEYFTLQGIRVEKPAPGIYIKRQGGTVTKIQIN